MSDDFSKLVDWQELMQRDEALRPELAAYYEPGLEPFPMVRHPLIYSIVTNPGKCALINAQYREKKAMVNAARDNGHFERMVWVHERPYRVSCLYQLHADGSLAGQGKVFNQLVRDVWMDTEFPGSCLSMWHTLWTSPMLESRKVMTHDETVAWMKLPDMVKVYRGTKDEEGEGFSWTLSRDTAKWFARRLGGEGFVLEKTVPRLDIAALLNGRNESECVIIN